jgi:hypothetical protein
MLAEGAKNAFQKYYKYVPPELALAQLAAEGGIGNNDAKSRPIITKNPFNISNTETASKTFATVQDGINEYFNLISRRYLGSGKTSNDLIYNFIDKNNQRYATAETYEKVVSSIAKQVNQIAKKV